MGRGAFSERPVEGAGLGVVGAGPGVGPFPRTRSFRSGPGAWSVLGRGGPCQGAAALQLGL